MSAAKFGTVRSLSFAIDAIGRMWFSRSASRSVRWLADSPRAVVRPVACSPTSLPKAVTTVSSSARVADLLMPLKSESFASRKVWMRRPVLKTCPCECRINLHLDDVIVTEC